MLEEKVAEQVQDYLEELGYPKHLLSSEVRTEYGQRVDIVVYDKGAPYIIVEIKSKPSFPKMKDADSLRFDSAVRQAQSYATSLNAPYYLVTNGSSFLWFTTDDSGRPELLNNPIRPSKAIDTMRSNISGDDVIRLFQDLRDFLFRNGASSPRDEAAIIIYAKLLSERGDRRLEEDLINASEDYNNQPDIVSIPFQELLKRTYYAQAFKLLNHISFQRVPPLEMLQAIDTVFISEQARYIPRWLADFLVRLSRIQANDVIFDLYSGYGDIMAAVLMLFEHNLPINVIGMTPNPKVALWALIQQRVLRKRHPRNNVILGDPYSLLESPTDLLNERPTRVIVAPPFGAKLDLAKTHRYRALHGTNLSEDLYLELAIDLVSEGGRVTALVPEGLLLSGNRKDVRAFVLANMQVTAIISLGTFLPYSKVKSSILILDKKVSPRPYEVSLFHVDKVSNVGAFDSRQIPQIAEILIAFQQLSDGRPFSTGPSSNVILSDKFDLNNMSASHYLTLASPSENNLVAQYATARLADITKEIKWGSKIKLDKQGNLPMIGPGMIRAMLLDPEQLDHTTKDKVPRRAQSVRAGDIVLNGIGMHTGEASVIDETLEGVYISQHVLLIRPDIKRVLPEYLAIALNSPFVKDQIEHTKKRTVIEGLTYDILNEIIIPVPSMVIQRALVERMSKARDELLHSQIRLRDAEMNFIRTIQDLLGWGLE